MNSINIYTKSENKNNLICSGNILKFENGETLLVVEHGKYGLSLGLSHIEIHRITKIISESCNIDSNNIYAQISDKGIKLLRKSKTKTIPNILNYVTRTKEYPIEEFKKEVVLESINNTRIDIEVNYNESIDDSHDHLTIAEDIHLMVAIR